MKSKQIKLLSASIGASAVIAMGALTVAFSDTSSAEPATGATGPVTTSEITPGETSTDQRRRPSRDTFATPSVTAEPPDGFGPQEPPVAAISVRRPPRPDRRVDDARHRRGLVGLGGMNRDRVFDGE